jgi:2-dehydro-3-deoxyphosphogluconate aldolase/(4S)-4-hydroxy-2-oxoglutarate aldolase
MSFFSEQVEQVIICLEQVQVVPVLAIEEVKDGIKMCEILNRQGLKSAEITFRTTAAETIIKKATKLFPDLFIGAGTILNAADMDRAFQAGARFAVAPGFNPPLVRHAIEKGYAFFPGVATPSEIEQAIMLGCRILKFFPAEASGGVAFLKSLIAPYKHLGIKFIPTGGLNTKNVYDYLNLPEVLAAGGTWLGKTADIKAGNWEKIEAIVIEAARMVRN